ncbi:putative beta-lysine N-acetyltransferase [Clostridium taeniosporum]|uniref:Putative beta-lysine N-acetyltransferase n=1 Tax=Clostridium taeniosporum TaxID=394958 RepID=A0A1D7XJ69_9CLOT|nr:putative beta-lysine N-acetyltransferase [Clostridium taeniosporum]AOR23388.1 putative beta-lysine N-acetyltransferase [Clostridium taeniosporum]
MSANYKLNNTNYYTNINDTKIYVDYINKRVKIIDLNNISIENIKKIIHFSLKENLSKILCNSNVECLKTFFQAGFDLEGKIEGYFKGKDAFLISYFVNNNRRFYNNIDKKNLILDKCLDLKNTYKYNSNNTAYHIRNANENDIEEMIKLFSNVFSTYPSPVYDEEFLRQTMNKKVLYKVATDNDKIIAIASADMDKENLNAEITDCATDPEYRGKGLLSDIVYLLELDLKDKGFIALYSLARAINPGINFVLSKHNYKFRGKLINNCNICGNFEDMNVWVKNINTDLIEN